MNVRTIPFLLALCAGILLLPLGQTAAAEDAIDGWGNLKFGMSIEEARAAEPRLNGDLKQPDYGSYKLMESDDKAVEIAGRRYRISASFGVNRQHDLMRLEGVTLSWESDPADAVYTSECENIFQEHVRLLVRKYGDFDDLKKNNPLATHDVDKAKSQIKETVDGSAVYFEKHFTMVDDFSFEAVKTLPQSKTIRVLGLPTSQGEETDTCRVNITFHQDLPAYVPPLPGYSESGETF